MGKQAKQIVKQRLEREFKVATRAIDEESRTVELAFSSEEPYERWFGEEVLSHDPQSVKLDRLNGGAAVLVNHDRDDQVGVVESARIDGDRRGRATVRFSRSARGEEIFQDVIDGIRSLVSVGYSINKYESEERQGQVDLVTVTEWEPHEISIVSIPADTTVGVGRSAEPDIKSEEETPMTKEVETVVEQKAPEFDADKERQKIRTEETKRTEGIRALAEQHDLPDLSKEAISEGWSLDTFRAKALEKVGERNNAARSEMKEEIDLGLDKKDREKFSFVRLMSAMENPNDRAAQKRAGHEFEVCAEAEKLMPGDFNARGCYIPPEILGDVMGRDLSAGTATDGAELVATNLLAGEYIEVLRNNMVSLQAGARMLPGLVGDVAIPRQTSGAAMTWISAEDGDATESEPQFDQVTLTPKDAAVYTEVTRRLMLQSTPAIEGIVRNDLFQAIALGLDSAVFNGSGASGQPQGIDGATGVDDPTIASATAPTYLELVTIVKTIMASNALRGMPVWALSPAAWESLMTTPKQGSGVEGNFILTNGTAVGYQALVTTQLNADDFVFGDFTNILIGEWGGLEINVDPYTHSLKGKTRFVAFKTCDIAIRHPEGLSFHDAA